MTSRHCCLLVLLALAIGNSFSPGAAVLWKPDTSSNTDEWNQIAAIEWLSICGSPKEDWINRVIETSDRSIVAAGYIGREDDTKESPDWIAVALKYSGAGKLCWSSAFGGPAVDAIWAIRETRDHDLVAGGFSQGSATNGWDAYLALLSANGDVRFEKHFGGSRDDRGTDVLVTDDGNFLLVGETRSFGAGGRDVFLVKTDRDGSELWHKAYGGPEMDRGFAAVETSDGGIVVIGATGTDDKHDGLVFRVDRQGNQIWRITIPGDKNVTPHFVNVLASGKICVVGYTDSWNATIHDYFAAVISPDGTVEKLQTLGGKDDDRAMTSVTDSRGGTWIIGYTKSFEARDWDILIAQLGIDGAFDSSVVVLGTGYADNGSAIAQARNGDLIVGGYTNSLNHGKSRPDLLVMRLNPKKLQRSSTDVAIKTIR